MAEFDGVTLVASGVAEADFNRMFVFAPVKDAAGAIGRARGFFGALTLPWCLVAGPEVAAAMAGVVAASGLLPGGTSPLMIRESATIAPPQPGFDIRPVGTKQEADVFARTMEAGFEAARGLFRVLAAPGAWDAPEVTHYIGYDAGQPVATATLVAAAGLAGVYNVAVAPAHRRRGFGDALTRRAAGDGLARGCTASVLQPTRMGLPLYRRLGYRWAGEYCVWYAPPPAPSMRDT